MGAEGEGARWRRQLLAVDQKKKLSKSKLNHKMRSVFCFAFKLRNNYNNIRLCSVYYDVNEKKHLRG